ncbi:MAG: 4-(cytidine 5'-diphospho)-2-C-methyl-D-erythritol kinase [Verrucomicrobia bacterium]|nr:4-(cytidine 5'-diphospho)-2-C-methyl-D-erythritol kinase [Verrucomicrobiota bacterium]
MKTYFSPAKLNLFFRVLSKRRDGYHEIASLFTAINFGDTLTISKSNKDSFTILGMENLPTDAKNLVIKALILFRETVKDTDPVAITLSKKIPIESGLGGGSSNAATTLWALNELYGYPLSVEELISLASTIGSDVPFFLSNGLAYCQGRGEIIENIKENISLPLWLIHREGLCASTPSVYKECEPSEVSREDPKVLLKRILEGDPLFVNDLEKAAFRLVPKLGEVKQALQGTFEKVALTGSGSAFFGYGLKENRRAEGIPVTMLKRSENSWYYEVDSPTSLLIDSTSRSLM